MDWSTRNHFDRARQAADDYERGVRDARELAALPPALRIGRLPRTLAEIHDRRFLSSLGIRTD